MSRWKKRALFRAILAATGIGGCFTASASINIWDGGGADSFFMTAANWVPDLAPAANDSLVFAGSTRLAAGNNFAAGTPFGGITFDSSAGSFTLGGNAITLPSTAGITNSSSNIQTVNLPLSLAFGNHSFVNAGTAALVLNGGLSRSIGATAKFSGTINISGLSNDATGILGPWATTGLDYAAISGGRIVPYAGYLELGSNPATIPNAPGSNVRWSQGDPASPGTSNGSTTLATGITNIHTLDFPVNNNGTILFAPTSTLRFGASGGVFKSANPSGLSLSFGTFGTRNVGTITAGGADNMPGELVFNVAGGQIFVYPTIADNGTGAVRVVSTATASNGPSINSSNSYSGGTYIAAGLMRCNDPSGAGFGTGSVQVAAAAQAYLDSFTDGNQFPGATYPNDFYLSGTGNDGNGNVGQGALRLGRNDIVVSGAVHLLSDSRITFHGAGTGNGAKITGKIAGPFALKLGGGNALSALTLTNAANDWAGNTSIDFGILRVGGSGEVIPNGPGKGDLYFTASTGTLDLSGKTETINALIDNNDDLDIHKIVSSSPGGKLIIGDNNASGSFGGFSSQLSDGAGQLSITKIGAGQQVLIGNNNYSGTTTVQGGRLVLVNNGDDSAWNPVFNLGGADIKGGRLVFNYNGSASPKDQVQSILTAGYGEPTRFSTGQLRSSNTPDAARGLGWKDDPSNNELTVAYTYFGDADLNGVVNALDFNALATNFGSTSKVWSDGDFNYDGTVNTADFTILAANFAKVQSLAAGSLVPALGATVPEPATLLLACTGLAHLLSRRRH
jgi:autotransporter-associated beta strand protein